MTAPHCFFFGTLVAIDPRIPSGLFNHCGRCICAQITPSLATRNSQPPGTGLKAIGFSGTRSNSETS